MAIHKDHKLLTTVKGMVLHPRHQNVLSMTVTAVLSYIYLEFECYLDRITIAHVVADDDGNTNINTKVIKFTSDNNNTTKRTTRPLHKNIMGMEVTSERYSGMQHFSQHSSLTLTLRLFSRTRIFVCLFDMKKRKKKNIYKL